MLKRIKFRGRTYLVVEDITDSLNEVDRIYAIRQKLEDLKQEFPNLNVAMFGYCKYSSDFEYAQLLSHSGHHPLEICREITKNKKEYQKEHRQLNIIHSYMDELTQLLKKHPEMIENEKQ